MKIAIEFYGHLRSFRDTAENIKNMFIANYPDVDIFIHTWDKTDHSDKAWHNKNGEQRGIYLTDDDIQFLNENYKPKKIVYEEQLLPEEGDNKEYLLKMTQIPMKRIIIKNIFYTKYRANELRKEYEQETGTKYDYVIQARLDLLFDKKFDIREYIEATTVIPTDIKFPIPDIDNKFFYCSDWYVMNQGKVFDEVYSSGSDVIYFGKPSVIDKVCSLYTNLPHINLEKDFYSNEYLLLFNARNNGLIPVKIPFLKDKEFSILRPDGRLSHQVGNLGSEKKKVKFFKKILSIKLKRTGLRVKILDLIELTIGKI
jgi:hypothetical protein